jgi:hypothetical protein
MADLLHAPRVGLDPARTAAHAVTRGTAGSGPLPGPLGLRQGAPAGLCARCGDLTCLHDLKTVLSRNFTDWQTVDPAGEGLCSGCAWSFTDPMLRTRAVLVDGATATMPGRAELRRTLSAPVPSTVALTVPVDGKKHLLPQAQWGTVTSDWGPLVWGAVHAHLFTTVLALRAQGATEGQLGAVAPPVALVLASADPGSVMGAWTTLDLWRGTPYWPVAVRASRPDRDLS